MSKQPEEGMVHADQKQEPINTQSEGKCFNNVDSSKEARKVPPKDNKEHTSYLNTCQMEYLARLSKSVGFILRMPVENGVLSDEKIQHAVMHIMHALIVIQSGWERGISSIKKIGKKEIEIIKEILFGLADERLLLKSSVIYKMSKLVVTTHLPDLISPNNKYSGFDIALKLLNDVLSAVRTVIAAASSTTLKCHDVDSTPCLPPEDGSPEDSKAAFAKYKIPYRGNQISLLEAVEKLRASLKNRKLYCPKTFAMDNKDVINGLLNVGLISSSTKYSLNEVCSYIISGIPNSAHKKCVTFGKLKKLFRRSYRRHQIFPCDQFCFKDLATKISNSATELEPGEEVERLWNREISLSFNALVTSQFQYISKTTESEESRLKWLKKFIDLLTTKKQLWPVGTMTAEFLKSKASEWLEVLKTNPMAEAANILRNIQKPELTKQELSSVKYCTYLDTPKNTKSPGGDVRFNTFPKKLSPNIVVGSDDTKSCKTTVDQPRSSLPLIHPSRLELPSPSSSTARISRHRSDDSVVGSESKDSESDPHCSSSRKGLIRHRSEESYVKGHDQHKNLYSDSPNSRSGCSRKKSSRHRSDESLADQRSTLVKSPRRKRYSNEYLFEQHRSTKRPKLDDRFFVKKMTDYDQKLLGFQIWDPLRNVTEAKFQDIFKTKEETVIANEQASVGTSSVTLDSNKTLDECEEKGLIPIIIEDIPLPKEDFSTNRIDQKPKISDNNEQQFKCKLGEIVNLCGLTENKGGHLRLQERYGEMKVNTEELDAERVSVIVTIQGYTFEGIATSRENAVEEASNKALLLAPFILQQTSNSLSEET